MGSTESEGRKSESGGRVKTRRMITAVCEQCGRSYLRRADAQTQRFCSRACKTPPVAIRFMRMVSPRGECWIWAGTKRLGYGLISRNGRQESAHRVSYELHTGRPIPEGLDCLHRCDEPSCVNPAHLFLGTHSDNMADMSRKGRAVNPSRKLTAEQARAIRLSTARPVDLARVLGVSPSTISNIRAQRVWRSANV